MWSNESIEKGCEVMHIWWNQSNDDKLKNMWRRDMRIALNKAAEVEGFKQIDFDVLKVRREAKGILSDTLIR